MLERNESRLNQLGQETEAVAQIPVELVNLPLKRVPVGPDGMSLRQVVTQALDQAGIAEVERYLVGNNKNFESVFGFPLPEGFGQAVFADEGSEMIMVVRGRNRMFIPLTVVNQTCFGRIRVGPGDAVLSLPNTRILKNQFWESEIPNKEKTVQVTGPFINPQSFQLSANHDLSHLIRAIPASANSSNLGPNIAILSREKDGFSDQIFAPIAERFHGNGSEGTFRDTLRMLLLNGEEIHLTRLELVPIVMTALIAPPPPVGPVMEPKQRLVRARQSSGLLRGAMERFR